MRKPVEKNDATMEVSASQLVPEPKPPARMGPPKNVPQNDRSMWAGAVVGTSDFAPPVEPKPKARRWLIIAFALAVVGGGGYVIYRAMASDGAETPPPTPAKPEPKPAVVIPPADAAVDAAVDAAPVDAPEDAAEPEAIIDAAVVPVVKPRPKKPVIKKATPKKKLVPAKRR
jgi:hypothetical protein